MEVICLQLEFESDGSQSEGCCMSIWMRQEPRQVTQQTLIIKSHLKAIQSTPPPPTRNSLKHSEIPSNTPRLCWSSHGQGPGTRLISKGSQNKSQKGEFCPYCPCIKHFTALGTSKWIGVTCSKTFI